MKLPTIEEQSCSFEQAKKLVFELKLRLDTQWYWVMHGGKWSLLLKWEIVDKTQRHFPAYTVAELGVLLPWVIELGGSEAYLIAYNNDTTYRLAYQRSNGSDIEYFSGKTEAQTRAEALIWLLDNKYLKAKDLRL